MRNKIANATRFKSYYILGDSACVDSASSECASWPISVQVKSEDAVSAEEFVFKNTFYFSFNFFVCKLKAPKFLGKMVETAKITTFTRTTTAVPAPASAPAAATTPAIAPVTAASATPTPTATTAARNAQGNDETARGIYNLKVIVFFLLLPLILFAVFLKHLLDYLFGLGEKPKDVRGKVAVVSEIVERGMGVRGKYGTGADQAS